MKKLMFAAAVAAGLVAFGDGIESANTVGYVSQAVANGKFAMIGVQFEGTDSNAMTVDALVKGDYTGVDYDENYAFFGTAPQIQRWTGAGYTYYYYLNDGWYDNGTEDGDYKAGWADSYGNIATDTLEPGEAVWFKATTGDCTVQTSGQIYEGETEVICASGKFTMLANATPIELDLNDTDQVTYSGLVGVDYDENYAFFGTAPQIQMWTGAGYTYYYYLNDGWYDNGTEDGDYKAGWCDSYGNIVTDKIPVGRGFWVKATNGQFTFCFK